MVTAMVGALMVAAGASPDRHAATEIGRPTASGITRWGNSTLFLIGKTGISVFIVIIQLRGA